MKITLETKPFRTRFAVAAAAVPSRALKPICEHVLVDLAAGKLTATDLERWTVVDFDGDGSRESFLLPAARTARILEAIRSESVSLATTSGKAVISGGGASFTIQTISDADFPRTPPVAKRLWSVRVSAATLCGALSRTRFAADDTSTRFALGGVCLFNLNGLAAAATDGRRLSVVPLGVAVDSGSRPIIPSATVAAIMRAMSGLTCDVDIVVSESAVMVSGGGVLIRSPLVDGRFPDTARAIPANGDRTLEITSGELLDIIDAAAIVCARDEKGELLAGCSFASRPGELVVRAVGAEVGESEVVTPCNVSPFGSRDLDVRLLRPWLQTIGKQDAVEVFFGDTVEPVKFTCGESIFVLMPLVKE